MGYIEENIYNKLSDEDKGLMTLEQVTDHIMKSTDLPVNIKEMYEKESHIDWSSKRTGILGKIMVLEILVRSGKVQKEEDLERAYSVSSRPREVWARMESD